MDNGNKLAHYDRLIAALSEEMLESTIDVRDLSSSEIKSDKQRVELLTVATDKCVRCVELIAKSLEASGKLCRLQKTLKNAYERSQEEKIDQDEIMEDVENAEDDEATTLFLQDLVTAGDEADDAVKNYARLGVVRKTAQASHKLLTAAERDLHEHLANNPDFAEDDAVQNMFRELYMEEFTAVFGDELDQFRQEERFESKDVSYLISCIQAGTDIFSPLQKKLFVESIRTNTSTVRTSET
ncbi:Ribosome-assembly protein 3 [Plasmopara halstedii]|uniref:Ribosome assembly protein 3 n=1 Tax=Plasmopara halstedii TaxID=4781 RepID=A0A0P1A818_PLAHL|nr:Ribosome-assembly protein 3 [Plasmopara halstedii]CEG36665.1 Ribosome-assembly protein 3 [Plasmopara halstedii]|eukprot:XP_024573034.1 Ribosome-assembly protein 3 [Plasmopara halstedii]